MPRLSLLGFLLSFSLVSHAGEAFGSAGAKAAEQKYLEASGIAKSKYAEAAKTADKEHAEAMVKAKTALVDEMAMALKEAMKNGDLDEANRTAAAQTEIEKKGELQEMNCKSKRAIDAWAGYRKAKSDLENGRKAKVQSAGEACSAQLEQARKTYIEELGIALKEAFKNRDLDEANRIDLVKKRVEKTAPAIDDLSSTDNSAPFAWRLSDARRKQLVDKYGGTAETEQAVESALLWLKAHQGADGLWDPIKLEGHNASTVTGTSGLALLAFLGAGHTEKHGPYKDTVQKAISALIKKQGADGAIGHNGPTANEHEAGDGAGYNHPIAGMALAEAAGMTNTPAAKDAAQKAVNYSLNKHPHKAAAGGVDGWRYAPGMEPDTSVTGWFVMQLKSAKMAGLLVSDTWTKGVTAYLDTVTVPVGNAGDFLPPGSVKYQAKDKGTHQPMTAVGMLCRQFMGAKIDDPLLVAGAKWLKEKPPVWIRPSGGGDVDLYYWYYGTQVMFQMGPDYFKPWNEGMKNALLGHIIQEGTYARNKGSWDPVCQWSGPGGRAYMTAMGAMCLEIYYRYLPMYQEIK
jgi:hypothetical protein